MVKKTLGDLEKLKVRWIDSDQSFELLELGFEEYFEGLQRFKEIHSVPKWAQFVAAIRGSVVFAKVYSAAMTDKSISVAFSLILGTLNSPSPNVADLTFGLASVNRILDDSDRTFIHGKLTQCRIELPINLLDPSSIIPAPPLSEQSANIRNSITSEPQVVLEKSRLKIDGLLSPGSFNRLSPTIWDAALSKIYPSREGEDYLARVSMAITTTEPTVVTIELDVNGVVIYKRSFQPTGWNNDLNVETIPFFASTNMRLHGAILNISATARTELRNVSLYLVRIGNG